MGPIVTAAANLNAVLAVFSTLSQPGMQDFRIAGSFNAAQTVSLGAAIRRSPVKSIKVRLLNALR
jgi:hypothetical protein